MSGQPETGLSSQPPQPVPASGLTDRFIVKTRSVGPGEMPEFRVTINGSDVASTGSGNTDITSMFDLGKNKIQVAWTPSQGTNLNRNWYVELTVGLQRNGQWSTIVKKQLPQSTEKAGTSTYTVMAR